MRIACWIARIVLWSLCALFALAVVIRLANAVRSYLPSERYRLVDVMTTLEHHGEPIRIGGRILCWQQLLSYGPPRWSGSYSWADFRAWPNGFHAVLADGSILLVRNLARFCGPAPGNYSYFNAGAYLPIVEWYDDFEEPTRGRLYRSTELGGPGVAGLRILDHEVTVGEPAISQVKASEAFRALDLEADFVQRHWLDRGPNQFGPIIAPLREARVAAAPDGNACDGTARAVPVETARARWGAGWAEQRENGIILTPRQDRDTRQYVENFFDYDNFVPLQETADGWVPDHQNRGTMPLILSGLGSVESPITVVFGPGERLVARAGTRYRDCVTGRLFVVSGIYSIVSN